MPNKHFYFALGACNGVAIVYAVRATRHWLFRKYRWMRALYRWDRDWFLYFPVVIGLFGILALTPDILHASHILPKEVTRGPLFNLFYFHSYFEWLENVRPETDRILNALGSIVLLGIAIGCLWFYVKEAKRAWRTGYANGDKESVGNGSGKRPSDSKVRSE